MPLDGTGFTPDITLVRQNVADQIRRLGNIELKGIDHIERGWARRKLKSPIQGTLFAYIAFALHNVGLERDYRNLGDVMRGLGYSKRKEARDAAHFIGCSCHGTPTAALVADRLEGLNTP